MTEELKHGQNTLRDYGFIAFLLERAFMLLQFLGPWGLIGSRTKYERGLEGLSEDNIRRKTRNRTIRVDAYVIIWLIIEIALICFAKNPRFFTGWRINILRAVALVRIVDIVQTSVNMAVFDHVRLCRKTHRMASAVRTLVLTVINYIELFVCFGVIYNTLPHLLYGSTGWSDAYYFSAISQLTVGYGDIAPLGYLKILAVMQGLIGYLFIVIILARFVSFLPRVKTVLED